MIQNLAPDLDLAALVTLEISSDPVELHTFTPFYSGKKLLKHLGGSIQLFLGYSIFPILSMVLAKLSNPKSWIKTKSKDINIVSSTKDSIDSKNVNTDNKDMNIDSKDKNVDNKDIFIDSKDTVIDNKADIHVSKKTMFIKEILQVSLLFSVLSMSFGSLDSYLNTGIQ